MKSMRLTEMGLELAGMAVLKFIEKLVLFRSGKSK
jgi:hypothetical protein